MRVLVVACILAVAACVRPVAVAAAPCPIWLSGVAATPAASVYALTFASAERGQATLRVRLFGGSRADDARFADVPFTTKRRSDAGTADIFDAAPVFVRLPDGSATPDGASLAIVDPDTGAPLACSGRDVSLADLERSPATPMRDPGRASRAARTYAAGKATVSATSVPVPAATCDRPYVPANIAGLAATLDYPAVARAESQTGTSIVAVELAATGKVLGTNLFETSGFPLLDAATRTAAMQTPYSAQIFRCAPVAGVYLFRGVFSHA